MVFHPFENVEPFLSAKGAFGGAKCLYCTEWIALPHCGVLEVAPHCFSVEHSRLEVDECGCHKSCHRCGSLAISVVFEDGRGVIPPSFLHMLAC